MITIINPEWATNFTAKKLTIFEEQQIAEKIVKYLRNEMSIICETNVEEQ